MPKSIQILTVMTAPQAISVESACQRYKSSAKCTRRVRSSTVSRSAYHQDREHFRTQATPSTTR